MTPHVAPSSNIPPINCGYRLSPHGRCWSWPKKVAYSSLPHRVTRRIDFRPLLRSSMTSRSSPLMSASCLRGTSQPSPTRKTKGIAWARLLSLLRRLRGASCVHPLTLIPFLPSSVPLVASCARRRGRFAPASRPRDSPRTLAGRRGSVTVARFSSPWMEVLAQGEPHHGH